MGEAASHDRVWGFTCHWFALMYSSRRLKTTQDGASHQMESALLVVEPIVEEYILSRVKHLPPMMDPQSMKA